MIRQIVHESACPVIALLDVEDAEFINKAAQIGIFAYIINGQRDQLQSSFGVALRRFAEYHGLDGAFVRRAITERAKGILMERHRSASTPPSDCSETSPGRRTRNSSTSPEPSPTTTHCYPPRDRTPDTVQSRAIRGRVSRPPSGEPPPHRALTRHKGSRY
jgi:hypothetical protein